MKKEINTDKSTLQERPILTLSEIEILSMSFCTLSQAQTKGDSGSESLGTRRKTIRERGSTARNKSLK